MPPAPGILQAVVHGLPGMYLSEVHGEDAGQQIDAVACPVATMMLMVLPLKKSAADSCAWTRVMLKSREGTQKAFSRRQARAMIRNKLASPSGGGPVIVFASQSRQYIELSSYCNFPRSPKRRLLHLLLRHEISVQITIGSSLAGSCAAAIRCSSGKSLFHRRARKRFAVWPLERSEASQRVGARIISIG